MSELYDFVKDALSKTGTKVSLGYGYNVNLKSLTAEKTPYMKLRIKDFKKFDTGLFLSAKNDLGVMAGIKLKGDTIKLDLGVCTELSELIDLHDIPVKGFMGISVSF